MNMKRKRIFLLYLILGLVIGATGFSFNIKLIKNNRSSSNIYRIDIKGGNSWKYGLSDMVLSKGSLYYVNYLNKLFRYDNDIKTFKFISKIDIMSGSNIFEREGYIYYSNGNSIYENSLNGKPIKKLISGKNIWIDTISSDSLIYNKDSNVAIEKGSKKFDYYIYNFLTRRSSVLIYHSNHSSLFFALNGDIAIGNTLANPVEVNNDELYEINIKTKVQQKLLTTDVINGHLLNGIFFYSLDRKMGIWYIDLKNRINKQLSFSCVKSDDYYIDRMTGCNNKLYVAVYYNEENHIIQIDKKTLKCYELGRGYGRVWRLCADEKNLYIYDTKSVVDKGAVTIISLSKN